MNPWLRNFILLALMLAASGLAIALRPHQKIADQGPKVDLAAMIPRAFGDWREELATSVQFVDPQQKEMIDKIYNQTLSRTYRNAEGYRIMLSIAYGSDQSDSLQLHKPEICYPAQGFLLEKKQVGTLSLPNAAIPVTRIMTTLGRRAEPVTYWTTVGNRVVEGRMVKKLAEMSFGLTGKIPDGMLIRVSSIDPDPARAYVVHDQFAAQMIESVPPATRERLAGKQ